MNGVTSIERRRRRQYAPADNKRTVRMMLVKGLSRVEVIEALLCRFGRTPKSLYYDGRTGYCSFM